MQRDSIKDPKRSDDRSKHCCRKGIVDAEKFKTVFAESPTGWIDNDYFDNKLLAI